MSSIASLTTDIMITNRKGVIEEYMFIGEIDGIARIIEVNRKKMLK